MRLIHWRQNDLNNHEAAARGDDLADVIEDLARAVVILIMQNKLKQIEVAACWHGLEEVAANEFQPGLMALDPVCCPITTSPLRQCIRARLLANQAAHD